MKCFFVGLLVIISVLILSMLGLLLFPIIIVMGFFLKWVLSLVFIIFCIWLIGKITLMGIDYVKRPKGSDKNIFDV